MEEIQYYERLDTANRDELTVKERKDLRNWRRDRTIKAKQAAAVAINAIRPRNEPLNRTDRRMIVDEGNVVTVPIPATNPNPNILPNLTNQIPNPNLEQPHNNTIQVLTSPHGERSESSVDIDLTKAINESRIAEEQRRIILNNNASGLQVITTAVTTTVPLVESEKIQREIIHNARKAIHTYEGNPLHSRAWVEAFRNFTEGLSEQLKRSLFFERLSEDLRTRFQNLFPSLHGNPTEVYLIWIEKAFYTGKSSLQASENLDKLTWDCFRVTFSTFLQKFEIATTRELGLSDEGRKIKLWKKLPNALCNALQIHFDSVDYYGLVRLITDHENLKFSVTANNNFVGPTSVASVANLESSDVNAMDHTSNRTDRDRGPRKFNDKKNIRCFKCRKPGHIAADCRDGPDASVFTTCYPTRCHPALVCDEHS
jgi:hypothetical protein